MASFKKGDHSDLMGMFETADPKLVPSDEWPRLIAAAKACGIPYGDVDEFNRRDPARYDERENRRRWDSFNREGAGTVGSGTVVRILEAAGGSKTVRGGTGAPRPAASSQEGWNVPVDSCGQLALAVRTLFHEGELVNVTTEAMPNGRHLGKWNPRGRGTDREANEFVAALEARADEGYAGLCAVLGGCNADAGAWWRANPVRPLADRREASGVRDADMARYDWALIECDPEKPEGRDFTDVELGESKERQLADVKRLISLGVPVGLVVDSGNKSIHVHVLVDAGNNVKLFHERFDRLRAYCERLGMEDVDGACRNPSRMSRLPGAMRNGKMQRLLYACPDPSKLEWDDERLSNPATPDRKSWAAVHRGPRGGILANELAKIIIDKYHARLIDGAPAVWNGCRWELGTRAIERAALDLADDATSKNRAEAIKYMQCKFESAEYQTSSSRDYDGRHYIQFNDATIRLEDGATVRPQPDMFIIGTIPISLPSQVPPNVVDEFLASVSGGDEATKLVLCEIAGACMCSLPIIQQAAMLVGDAPGARGTASNGKSTFLSAVRTLLGAGNVSSISPNVLGQRFQASMLVGKLANLGDDIPSDKMRSEELANFKKLVTCDVVFTDVKGLPGFSFRPVATHVFSMNRVPKIDTLDDGLSRRLSFVGFMQQFRPGTDGYDPAISEKLATPEALARLALLGMEALPGLIQRREYTRIPSMDAVMAEARRESDSVERWIEERPNFIAETMDCTPVSGYFKDYQRWCGISGERYPVTNNIEFTKRLKRCGRFDGYDMKTSSDYYAPLGKNVRLLHFGKL